MQVRLPPDERCRFSNFIEASTKAATKPADGTQTNAPTCLRVSLCGASNTRVRADIFHVPVPHLFGADHPYHLLAISEDSESRNPPACSDAVPDLARITAARARTPSSTSGSSSGSTIWQPLPELAGVMLLVDGSSPSFDIEQAHLSFERRVSDNEAESAIPSLRKFCRPTDWEPLRQKLHAFAAAARQDAAQKGRLKKMCLRMPDDQRKFLGCGYGA